MLHDLAVIVKPEAVDPRPVAVTGPFLVAVKDDVVPFGDHSLEVHALARIFLRHPHEVFDERLLAVTDPRIVLDVGVTGLPFNGLGWPALVEHKVVEAGDGRLVLLQLVHDLTSDEDGAPRLLSFGGAAFSWKSRGATR